MELRNYNERAEGGDTSEYKLTTIFFSCNSDRIIDK